jgi:hypothetical protein
MPPLTSALLEPKQTTQEGDPPVAFKTYHHLLQRIVQLEQQIAKAIPVTETFFIETPTNTITLANDVNTEAPIWVVYECLPQKKNIDFTITGNIFNWVNTTDTEIFGDIEITYYKA